MSSDFANHQLAPTETDHAESQSYEAPAVVVLGTVAELTQGNTPATDELNNDGSQF